MFALSGVRQDMRRFNDQVNNAVALAAIVLILIYA